MSAPATGDEDPSVFAEAARDMGVEHYLLLSGIRQGIVNLFATALYHLFEQQLMLFHRRELLQPAEENDASQFNVEALKRHLRRRNIDVAQHAISFLEADLRVKAGGGHCKARGRQGSEETERTASRHFQAAGISGAR
jgi:hypothetical protein